MRYITYPIVIVGIGFSSPLFAQSDDRSYLTALLEDNLSGAGRKVTITGFSGALSSSAKIQQLTIADDQGIWLSLDDVVLDWSRSALFSGALVVNELSASQITLARLPQTEEDPTKLEAEPFEFALPDLPLSIDIAKISAPKIVLGEPILGEEVTAELSASVNLANGEGYGKIDLVRLGDAPAGQLHLDAGYTNETGVLILDLNVEEAAQGLAAKAMGLPNLPSTQLSLKGQGEIDNFSALFQLKTDNIDRLSGPITLSTQPDGERKFVVAFEGNPAPLFVPEYSDFLGNDLDFTLSGRSKPSGEIYIDGLNLSSQALNLTGQVQIAADGMPEVIDINGSIAHQDSNPVLLPIPGDIQTRIKRADLHLGFDASKGSAWNATLAISGLDRSDVQAKDMLLIGTGVIDRQNTKPGVSGSLLGTISGIAGLAPDLSDPIGQSLNVQTDFAWREGDQKLSLPQISVKSDAVALDGDLTVLFAQDLALEGKANLQASDLSKFSKLSGQNLSGHAQVSLVGQAEPLNGTFDIESQLSGQTLAVGIPELDKLLQNKSEIFVSAKRDAAGITLRDITAKAASFDLAAKGQLNSTNSALNGSISFSKISDLGAQYRGSFTTSFNASGTVSALKLVLDGRMQDLRIGQAEADKLIGGNTTFTSEISMIDQVVRVDSLDLNGEQITAKIAQKPGSTDLSVDAAVKNIGLVVPQFNGRMALNGTVRPDGNAAQIDLKLTGPAAIQAQIQGKLDGNQPNLHVIGTANAALANTFTDPVTVNGSLSYDVNLRGGWTPQNISGQVKLNNGQMAVPARGFAFNNIQAAIDLNNSTARVNITAQNGNREGRLGLEGSVQINAPYVADLNLSVRNLRLRDPELYDTIVNSQDIKLVGPILGNASLSGAILIGVTELRVPSTGFSSGADLAAISHTGDPEPVILTRKYAGVNVAAQQMQGSSGLPNWALNLRILAPNQIFIRGRGLDAELGGEITVRGTLNNIIPSGGFDLIRGRLDILGKRLTLNAASLLLEGDFIPSLNVQASNVSSTVTSFVNITGRADDPQITFTSQPELPQEEVLAWLLFGRSLESISAFQAAQLATAVATLAGSGGSGILGNLRKGLGVDDLDVKTAEDGTTSVSAGRYLLKDKIYSEVGVDQSGNTRINLNYDINQNVKVKGRMDANGQSGIGVYLQKDY